MRHGRLASVVLAGLCLFKAHSLLARQHSHTEMTSAEKLGTVSFPVSCKSSVQHSFERGVALLHSFGYNLAQEQFQEIEQEDPACAMAYWGEAMSLYHQLWDRPSAETLGKGKTLIEKAEAVGVKTAREHGDIEAAAAFFQAGSERFVR